MYFLLDLLNWIHFSHFVDTLMFSSPNILMNTFSQKTKNKKIKNDYIQQKIASH